MGGSHTAAYATEQSGAPAHISAYPLQAVRMANLESSRRRRECAGGLDDVLNDAAARATPQSSASAIISVPVGQAKPCRKVGCARFDR